MTTKELLKKLEDRSPFLLAWAVMWRWFIIVIAFYTISVFISLVALSL